MAVKHFLALADSDRFESPQARYVALEAAFRADSRGVVRVSQAEMATVTRLGIATVKRQFRALEADGLLTKQGHGRYLLRLGVPADVAATSPTNGAGRPAADDEYDEGTTILVDDEWDFMQKEGERLAAIRQPHQGIVYDDRGRPKLVDWPADGY